MARWRRGGQALAVLLAMWTVAADGGPAPGPPLRPRWQAAHLPPAPAPYHRLTPRDVAHCGDRWYVVGAAAAPDGRTLPMAWASPDGHAWRALPLHPRSFYGRQAIFSSVACAGGRAALIGAKIGGAHGNPRTATWRALPGGGFAEVPAGFELFGGPQALYHGALAAGPGGFLIAGARMSGGAAWHSADGGQFTLADRAAALTNDDAGENWPYAAVATAAGWLVVGGRFPYAGGDRDPHAWSSPDARTWRAEPVPAAAGMDELRLVAAAGPGELALGVRGDRYAVWRRSGGRWSFVATFGRVGGADLPDPRELTAAGSAVHAVTADGRSHRLWRSTDGGGRWRPVALPASAPAGGDARLSLAASADRLVASVDDGAAGGVWVASVTGWD